MMADISPNYKLGEYSRDSILRSVKIGGTNLTLPAGQLVKITSIDTDGTWVVEPIATGNVTDIPRGVLVSGDNTKSGEYSTVVIQGDVCVEVGTEIVLGNPVHTKGGKAVKHDATAPSAFRIGWSQGAPTAAGDTVLIWFEVDI